jgi:predicted metal-dependent peptidase
MDDEVDTKLSAARTRLILDKPFLGALALRLPLAAADAKWCPTTATDARALYYNRDYIKSLSLAETEFVLAHEALHCALAHFARRQHRVKHRWDLACDLAINPLLIGEGLKPPPNALVVPGFEDMTAEEIYPCLDENDEQETMDRHVYDESNGNSDSASGGQPDPARDGGGRRQPPPLSATERDALAVQWQQRLAGAAQQAQQAGKLTGAMARLVDHLLQPQLPWRMLLARYLTAVARDDYSFTRPSRREGTAILPSLRSSQVELTVAIDTSGSIGRDELNAFLAEVNALKGQVRARITLHACDSRLAAAGPWVCEPWEELTLPSELPGGGGTSFVPVFEWSARQDRAPDLLVYFTDAQGEFPARAPEFPVLWLVKGKAKPPWGRRIQLN